MKDQYAEKFFIAPKNGNILLTLVGPHDPNGASFAAIKVGPAKKIDPLGKSSVNLYLWLYLLRLYNCTTAFL